jgi:hypothetical protein
MAGRKGKCRKCGAVIPIPGSNASAATNAAAATSTQAAAATRAAPPAVAPAQQLVCSICQTAIAPGETAGACSLCKLPFHVDCWEANLGCATYGCKNVNALKPGPDIAISQAAVSQPYPGAMPGSQYGARSHPPPAEASDIPWEYLFLAASAIAGLISCVGFGIPSLLVAFGAGVYASSVPNPKLPVLAAVWGICGVTFFMGLIASAIMWMT